MTPSKKQSRTGKSSSRKAKGRPSRKSRAPGGAKGVGSARNRVADPPKGTGSRKRRAAKPPEKNRPGGRGDFPVVGIGASAGGLAAFEEFFAGMPPDLDPGMAFVLVQHLAPDHHSILTDLIQRHTRMRVFEVEDGMIVQPNCAYIIPPNRDMALLNGTLQLLEPAAPRGHRLPIDFFFQSLAQDQRERAICVILSGTGSDGTLGARAIKAEGGMVMVQAPDSTDYDGMPRSVLATGLVDYELAPAEMPVQLMAYAAHAFGRPGGTSASRAAADNAMKKIFVLLRSRVGHDFSQYKSNTILRRIERRMAIQEIGTIEGYLRRLQQRPAEIDALFHDLLIGVTNFFRDPEAFKVLGEKIIPAMLSRKTPGAIVRVWSVGCATGEEAYSLAILLYEQMEAMKQNYRIQIFATDIDARAIDRARSGLFPASVRADITPERLRRFFTLEPDGNTYRVNKAIRDLIVFSEQDAVRDPPFSRQDLISCRNLLIYMGSELQKKLIPLFHYALNPEGLLFLGVSESVGEFVDLFSAIDPKAKLYQRNEVFNRAKPGMLGRFLSRLSAEDDPFPSSDETPSPPARLPLRELTEQAIVQQVAPAAVLVNGRGEILYLHGRTGAYLEPAPGEAGVDNVLKMARQGLQRELSRALQHATKEEQSVTRPGLRVKTNGDFTFVDLSIHPVAPAQFVRGRRQAAATSEKVLYLIVLQQSSRTESAAASSAEAGDSDVGQRSRKRSKGSPKPESLEQRLAQLEQELQEKEHYLQVTNEELETSSEELRSSNEEMQSVNEELRCTNEELETSKEELQSVNEELTTVNTELQTKVADLSLANNDMNNLLAGTGIATIFVDHQLRILRFTPAATQIIHLISSDAGRPVGHIVSNLKDYDDLVADVQRVLDTLVPKELEVQTKEGQWFMLRILPYRTLDNVIEGAVITLVDITEQILAREALAAGEAQRRLAVAVGDSRDPILIQTLDGDILAWNPAAERVYGWSEEEALKKNIRDLIPGDERENELSRVAQLCRSEILEPYTSRRIARDGRIVPVMLTATALIDRKGKVYAIATTEREVSMRK